MFITTNLSEVKPIVGGVAMPLTTMAIWSRVLGLASIALLMKLIII